MYGFRFCRIYIKMMQVSCYVKELGAVGKRVEVVTFETSV
jgi:hypothetical protein